MQMAGLLHDTLEDTDLTSEKLLRAGVPGTVVDLVQRVTNGPDTTYRMKIESIVTNYGATLIKIADNAHNSLPDRTAQLPSEKRELLAHKYADARSVLWAAVPREDDGIHVEGVDRLDVGGGDAGQNGGPGVGVHGGLLR